MSNLNLTNTLKTMREIGTKVTEILRKHHTIDKEDEIEIISFGVEHFDSDVIDVSIKFYLSIDEQRHEVSFLVNKSYKKLDYGFITGYIAKYIEDLEI